MELGAHIHKRVHHIDEPNIAHALTFSCFGRKQFLKAERACNFLAEGIHQAREKHRFHVWAYVFMPEHVHLLIFRTEQSSPMREILHGIKQSVARRALIYLRKNNPAGLSMLATGQKHSPYRFWLDGGGFDQIIENRQSIENVVNYIHGNPVRRGLCTAAEDWKWSSASDWAGMGQGVVPIDRQSFPVL
jgi:putative transposase